MKKLLLLMALVAPLCAMEGTNPDQSGNNQNQSNNLPTPVPVTTTTTSTTLTNLDNLAAQFAALNTLGAADVQMIMPAPANTGNSAAVFVPRARQANQSQAPQIHSPMMPGNTSFVAVTAVSAPYSVNNQTGIQVSTHYPAMGGNLTRNVPFNLPAQQPMQNIPYQTPQPTGPIHSIFAPQSSGPVTITTLGGDQTQAFNFDASELEEEFKSLNVNNNNNNKS